MSSEIKMSKPSRRVHREARKEPLAEPVAPAIDEQFFLTHEAPIYRVFPMAMALMRAGVQSSDLRRMYDRAGVRRLSRTSEALRTVATAMAPVYAAHENGGLE